MTVTAIFPSTMTEDGLEHTYTDDSSPTTGLDGGGHVTRFVPALKDCVSVANYITGQVNNLYASGIIGTSNTSTSILVGSKTFAITNTGSNFIVGQMVKVIPVLDETKYIIGEVTSFSGTTLVINATSVSGTGTYGDWKIYNYQIGDLNGLSDVVLGGVTRQTGQVLRYSGSNWQNTFLSIDDLSEVTITSPVAYHVLQYTGSGWINSSISLTELSDVVITTPTSGQVLKYNGSTWRNETATSNLSILLRDGTTTVSI